jgi:lipopolysaccharide/colanic/teichoic acid biosynthesis glycosyltransferase
MKSPAVSALPRPIDVAVSLAALTLAVPLLAISAVAVALSSPGPILFRHQRIGRGGRRFAMLKFRTMRAGSSGPQVTAKRDPRITGVGRVLRKTKLDEVPELWNVVRGDMSLVGPRPEAAQYVDASSPLWRDVLAVRPGVTDPMTLRLRNEEELLALAGTDHEAFYRRYLLPYKLQGYREYLSARSWKSDLRVLWLTALGIVFPGRVPPPSAEEIVSTIESAEKVRPDSAVNDR